MNDGWKKDTLGHHIELLTGYPFKSTEYSEGEKAIRLLRGDNVVQGSIRWEGVKRWDGPLDNKIQRYSLAVGDFVIAMDRTWVKPGLKALITTDEDTPSLLVQRVARLRVKKSLQIQFLPMLIRSHRFEQYVKGVQTETAVPHISPNQIKDFPVILPPLPEQKAIAGGTVPVQKQDAYERNRNLFYVSCSRAKRNWHYFLLKSFRQQPFNKLNIFLVRIMSLASQVQVWRPIHD